MNFTNLKSHSMLDKSIFCKYSLEECRCALWSSLALWIVHIDAVYPKLLSVATDFIDFGKTLQVQPSSVHMHIYSQIALSPFKVVHQRPRKITFQVHPINQGSYNKYQQHQVN